MLLECYYCKEMDDDTRPYAPGGQPTCLRCAQSPEHEAEVITNFHLQLATAQIQADGLAGTPEGVVVLNIETGAMTPMTVADLQEYLAEVAELEFPFEDDDDTDRD